MSRLSFEKKRAQPPTAHPAVVPVRVFGAGSASVGGTPVVAAPGEEIQQAVLNHLQRLAISLGAPIRATIHDDREGCVVPLEVSADGSSRVTGEPVRVNPQEKPSAAGVASREEPRAAGTASPEGAAGTGAGTGAASAQEPAGVPAGTVRTPMGQFGPPPVMTGAPAPTPPVPPAVLDVPQTGIRAIGFPKGVAGAAAAREPGAPVPAVSVLVAPELVEPPASTHTPARGFDAVAEEVLGDGPVTETVEGAALLTEAMTRINEAVRAGRIEAAARLADRTVAEATTALGPGHAEVLHLRELAAYIAYLGGEPVRAFELSLDLARLRRQARDAEAAYGNVQSAATAWRAVRDPEEGLRLGRDLIELWTDLSAEPGPAADDPGPLESARARMVRLTDRAARAAQP
ncbi:hypothetical protein ABT274_20715 [Streptomyces sp. NPDC001127]|uniref:hypothetical protein n=1 Tax=Streptomyces sp. NPDC001127 TaxID=3154377 RepID=UPI00331C92CF